MLCSLFRCSHLILSTACNQPKRTDRFELQRNGSDSEPINTIHFLCIGRHSCWQSILWWCRTLLCAPRSLSFIDLVVCMLSDLLLDGSISNRSKVAGSKIISKKSLENFNEHICEIDGFSFRIATKTSAEIGIHSELICIFKSISCNFRINSLKMRKTSNS